MEPIKWERQLDDKYKVIVKVTPHLDRPIYNAEIVFVLTDGSLEFHISNYHHPKDGSRFNGYPTTKTATGKKIFISLIDGIGLSSYYPDPLQRHFEILKQNFIDGCLQIIGEEYKDRLSNLMADINYKILVGHDPCDLSSVNKFTQVNRTHKTNELKTLV